ncbi:Gfo/Idh/MocA family oxidoreductase [Shewanella canadensis]|uniref:Gfo/Idh/MocA family oxidoreductase n=1 Tax=Shewanella canadensis TaxID=271096 RepID=A0A431WXE7_9GAMM|nr:Gfo/Idh/MocA family oxidoreductase [Shewanella canadensis]RTR39953.1 Gfo/Idh/MocA family oxidoreductase [Shewanella canadensis]
MNKTLNWGILGTSFISGVMADAIVEEGHTCLHSVAGRSEKTLMEFAEKYDIANIYQDYDALINDDEVDIIYIALPNHLHHDFVIKAANAGKAILCEKSLSIDMKKTDEALAAVANNQVFFAEGLMYLTHPFARKISEIIRLGTIGDIRSINGVYCASIAQFVNPDSKGALYNLGCYPASLMHLVMQQAFGDGIFDNYRIAASGRVGEDGNICESAASIQFANGVICQLHTAEDYGLHADFTILGSKGSLVLVSNPWLAEATGNQLVITQYEQQGKAISVPADGNGFLYQVRLIREAIEQGSASLQRPAATPEDSRQIMKILTDWEVAAQVR